MPEALPRDTNNRGVLSPLATIGRKQVLMAHSQGEGHNFYYNVFFVSNSAEKLLMIVNAPSSVSTFLMAILYINIQNIDYL